VASYSFELRRAGNGRMRDPSATRRRHRLATREIVHHIRCEARTAIKQAIIDYLRKLELTDFMDRLESNRLPLDQLDLHLNELPATARANIVKYERAAISYDFTFDITEQNTVAAEVDFANLLSQGAFSLPARGSNDLQRQSVRIFRVNDTFGELINFRRGRCTEDGSPEKFRLPRERPDRAWRTGRDLCRSQRIPAADRLEGYRYGSDNCRHV
jgi:hypothetical protein